MLSLGTIMEGEFIHHSLGLLILAVFLLEFSLAGQVCILCAAGKCLGWGCSACVLDATVTS